MVFLYGDLTTTENKRRARECGLAAGRLLEFEDLRRRIRKGVARHRPVASTIVPRIFDSKQFTDHPGKYEPTTSRFLFPFVLSSPRGASTQTSCASIEAPTTTPQRNERLYYSFGYV